MKLLQIFFFAAFFVQASAHAAEASTCVVSDKEFLHQITSSSDWLDVHAVFKRNFPSCKDEGLYADGYTNLVVGVMATNWADLALLDDLTKKNAGFERFILRHIGASAGENDLSRVLHSAKVECPTQSVHLCQQIAKRCKEALSSQ